MKKVNNLIKKYKKPYLNISLKIVTEDYTEKISIVDYTIRKNLYEKGILPCDYCIHGDTFFYENTGLCEMKSYLGWCKYKRLTKDSMNNKWIPPAIGNTTNPKIIRGRENVPTGDNFAWWSCHYEYRNKNTNEVFRLEGLQEKYNLGFLQRELWDIIEHEYISEEVYIMSVNHPKYDKNDNSDDIVFED